MQTIRFIVCGRVQGVGFRNYVYMEASHFKLDGYVRNQLDGSVECVARGEEAELDRLRAILHSGPPLSQVRSVSEEMLQLNLPQGFELRY